MTKSYMIKEMIMQLLSDGAGHSVSEMKDYLFEKGLEDYSEGQFAGSVNNLLRNKKIENGTASAVPFCLVRPACLTTRW